MKVFTFARQMITICVFSMILTFAPQSPAASYTSLVVFGDSLSDSGNIFDLFGGALGPNAPFTEGRFTSKYTNGDPGLVWVEHLAAHISVPLDNSIAGGSNYAYGGARAQEGPSQLIPSLPDQLSFYYSDLSVVGATVDQTGLFVVYAGGNDVRDNDASNSGAAIGVVIQSLYDQGARNFLIPNLPDIGLTPESLAGLAPGGLAAVISAATATHNAGVAAQLATLAGLEGINIFDFDLFVLFNDILSDPATFGLTNVNQACAGLEPTNGFCIDPDTYLFFDGIHPTAIVHEMMGQRAYNALNALPIAPSDDFCFPIKASNGNVVMICL